MHVYTLVRVLVLHVSVHVLRQASKEGTLKCQLSLIDKHMYRTMHHTTVYVTSLLYTCVYLVHVQINTCTVYSCTYIHVHTCISVYSHVSVLLLYIVCAA